MNRSSKMKKCYLLSKRHKNRILKKKMQAAKITNRQPASSTAIRSTSPSSSSSSTERTTGHINTDVRPTCSAAEGSDSYPEDSSSSHVSGDFKVDGGETVHLDQYHTSMENDINEEMTNEKEKSTFRSKLAAWSVQNNVSLSATNELMAILRTHPCHSDLPQDARSLKKTPRSCEVKAIAPGQYLHFGIEEPLQHTLKANYANLPSQVHLLINVDGIPLSKSSNSQFWPILGSVASLKNSEPFIIGVYHGYKKPDNANEFLKDFVDEACELTRNGISYGGTFMPFKILGFICDAPARAFITCTKGHTGYFGCGKCTQEGQYIGRMCFPERNFTLRTDSCFRNKEQEEHHLKTTILEQIPHIGLVTQIPFEYMHLVCLGVMRKILNCLIKGKDHAVRVRSKKVDDASNLQVFLSPYICSDFVRKPRPLKEFDRFKATEFRLILLYTGHFVLKPMLSQEFYEHFLCLLCAMRILASPILALKLNCYAKSLLNHFVEVFEILYGRELVSYNVHGLLHLADDVTKFGPLDSFSAFQFENYLQSVKKLVKKSSKPLQQLGRRIFEQKLNPPSSQQDSKPDTCKKPHFEGPLIAGCQNPQYKTITINNSTFSAKTKDHCCMMKDNSIVIIENIATCASSQDPVIVGRKFSFVDDDFIVPCKSSKVGIFITKNLSNLKMWKASDIVTKALKYPKCGTEFQYVTTLLHCSKCGI